MARTQLSKAEWATAALFAIGRVGVAGLAVEPLAKELGVSKGSFYWHFSSLDELVGEVVDHWAKIATEDIIQALSAISDPRERLRALIDSASGEVGTLQIEAGLMAAAVANDPRVRPVYERVSKRRLTYLEEIYAAIGFSKADAKAWGITAYTAYLGSVQYFALTAGGAGKKTAGGKSQKEQRANVNEHLAKILIPARATKPRTAR